MRRKTEEESGPVGGTDNRITCTHRINYQSGRDCATPGI